MVHTVPTMNDPLNLREQHRVVWERVFSRRISDGYTVAAAEAWADDHIDGLYGNYEDEDEE